MYRYLENKLQVMLYAVSFMCRVMRKGALNTAFATSMDPLSLNIRAVDRW